MCSDSPTGSDDSEETTASYELDVDVSPNGAGTVSPSSGTYDSGEEVSISASSEQGWEFDNWSGASISSSENPLNIIMNEDRNITANFVESQPTSAESFEGMINVTDGEQARDLIFSASDGAGIDQGLDDSDLEGPPIAPQGVFFTGFSHEGMNLYEDVRPVSDEIIWKLRLQRSDGATMRLDWSLQESLNGQLQLVEDPESSTPDVSVNMLEESSYELTDQNIQYLYIEYSASEAGKEKAASNNDNSTFKDDIEGAKNTINK